MPGSGTGPSFEITSNRVRPRAMTLGSPWIHFAAPAMVGGRRRSDSPAGPATPKGVARTNLEYMLRSVLPASHTVGTLPSEELFPAHRRRQPLKHDLTTHYHAVQ